MQTKAVLNRDDVARILSAARAEASQNGWAVSIAVVVDGGPPLARERRAARPHPPARPPLDGGAPIGAYICVEKARTSALGRRESKGYEDMINGGRNAFLSVPVLTGMLEGGVPLVVDGQVVGAVGVSGVKPEQDAQVARAGALAVQAG
jgi:glc operon protein GlcG